MAHDSIGLVLSGGGARGAYEVGVLRYIAQHFPGLLERVQVIAGSSVGAVNTAYLASRGLDPKAVEDLVALWTNLELDRLVTFSSLSAVRMLGAGALRLLRGGTKSPVTGLIDADGLWQIVAKETDWDAIHRHVRNGRFKAVAITATEIARGETHVFVDARDSLDIRGQRLFTDFVAIPGELNLPHVLASAAIPFLFPPIRIGTRWYVDGGVRHNTPLSPALRFGADALLIITVSGHERTDASADAFPGIGEILGTMLDATFVDRVAFDLDRLDRINDFLAAIDEEEPALRDRITARLRDKGRSSYRYVPYGSVKPSIDFGAVAAESMREIKASGVLSMSRLLAALFEDDPHRSGEAASFLLFDGRYASKLIAHGYADAKQQHAALAEL
jgi:NTE family protein